MADANIPRSSIIELDSIVIRSVQHDGETLRVHTRGGRSFDLEDVSEHLFTNLVHSQSPGHYLVHHILPDRERIPVKPGDPFPLAGG